MQNHPQPSDDLNIEKGNKLLKLSHKEMNAFVGQNGWIIHRTYISQHRRYLYEGIYGIIEIIEIIENMEIIEIIRFISEKGRHKSNHFYHERYIWYIQIRKDTVH